MKEHTYMHSKHKLIQRNTRKNIQKGRGKKKKEGEKRQRKTRTKSLMLKEKYIQTGAKTQ